MITKIECPKCKGEAKPVNDWFWDYSKGADWLHYFTCKACKTKLGSTLMMDGGLAIWDKSTEKNK